LWLLIWIKTIWITITINLFIFILKNENESLKDYGAIFKVDNKFVLSNKQNDEHSKKEIVAESHYHKTLNEIG